MLTEQDFDHAYGPFLKKWEGKLGKAELTELVADLSPAIQGLIQKMAVHQTKAVADVAQHGVATFEAFRKKHGH